MSEIYIGLSKGRGFFSFLIRFLTSLAMRREEMIKDNVSNLIAPLLILLSLLNITKYSKLKVRYNHTFFLYYSDDFNSWFVIDIIKNGIVLMPAEKTFRRSDCVKIVEPNFNLWEGVKKTSKYFGSEYDFIALPSSAWSIVKFILTGAYKKDVRHNPRKFICSEYVATGIEASGIEIGEPIAIYPNSISELTETDNRFKTVIEKNKLTINDLIVLA